ncbi:MAG: 2'-5' RNA ligase family protein [Pseudomonadota bacterium]
MSSKYFVFLYPDEGLVKKILDLSIFILDPQEKWPAHITVAGPFATRRRFHVRRHDYRSRIAVFGVANFFRSKASTVYFNLQLQDLDAVWSKPDFPFNRIPHLTLYSGGDLEFAKKIYEMASQKPRKFSFNVTGVNVVKSTSNQFQSDLRQVIDFEATKVTVGLNFDSVAALPSEERINIVSQLLDIIPTNFTPTVVPNF